MQSAIVIQPQPRQLTRVEVEGGNGNGIAALDFPNMESTSVKSNNAATVIVLTIPKEYCCGILCRDENILVVGEGEDLLIQFDGIDWFWRSLICGRWEVVLVENRSAGHELMSIQIRGSLIDIFLPERPLERFGWVDVQIGPKNLTHVKSGFTEGEVIFFVQEVKRDNDEPKMLIYSSHTHEELGFAEATETFQAVRGCKHWYLRAKAWREVRFTLSPNLIQKDARMLAFATLIAWMMHAMKRKRRKDCIPFVIVWGFVIVSCSVALITTLIKNGV